MIAEGAARGGTGVADDVSGAAADVGTADPTATRCQLDHGRLGTGLRSWLSFELERLGAETDVRRESFPIKCAPGAIDSGFDYGSYRSGLVAELTGSKRLVVVG